MDKQLMTSPFVEAIAKKYETPYLLHQAYTKCKTQQEKKMLIYNTVEAPEAYPGDASDYSDHFLVIKFLKENCADVLEEDQKKELKKISIAVYTKWFGK